MLKDLGRVRRRRVRTRETLLRAARELFYEKGIYWTKIEDITDQADVAKGSFYQHFSTKEELLQCLLRQGFDDLLDHTRKAVRPGRRGKFVLPMISAQLEFYLEHPDYLLMFHQVRGFLQLKGRSAAKLRRVYVDYIRRLGNLIRPGLNGSTRPAGSATDMAMTVSALSTSMLTYHLLFGDRSRLNRGRKWIRDRVDRSLRLLRLAKAARV